MLAVGMALGYALGTWLGDLYAGHSTWALLELNRQRFVGMLASSVAISIAFVGFFYQRSKAEALQRQASEAKLMLLQSQLEPHMLFNTLAHLRALVTLQPAQAVAMIDHLDDYLRRALHASRQPMHPLSEEFARLHDYLSLMQLRMGERLRFTLSLPPELATQLVPSLILQPLVENAIRHGLEPAVRGGTLMVRAHSAQGQLRIDVCDSGLGCSHVIAPKGYGLTHVRERLQALWGATACLTLTTPPTGGTSASLCWPLHTTSRIPP
jgi:LytS/YehU family sensor histidine kinase